MGAARELINVGYEPAPESKTPLNMRVPKSLKAQLEDIVKLWSLQAKARGEDPTNIDVTHVATTLLKNAAPAEFDSYGGRPKDDAGWKKLEVAIREGVEANALKSSKK